MGNSPTTGGPSSRKRFILFANKDSGQVSAFSAPAVHVSVGLASAFWLENAMVGTGKNQAIAKQLGIADLEMNKLPVFGPQFTSVLGTITA